MTLRIDNLATNSNEIDTTGSPILSLQVQFMAYLTCHRQYLRSSCIRATRRKYTPTALGSVTAANRRGSSNIFTALLHLQPPLESSPSIHVSLQFWATYWNMFQPETSLVPRRSTDGHLPLPSHCMNASRASQLQHAPNTSKMVDPVPVLFRTFEIPTLGNEAEVETFRYDKNVDSAPG